MAWSQGTGRPKWVLLVVATLSCGCHSIPLTGQVNTDAKVTAGFQGSVAAGIQGTIDVRIPTAPDPGPMVPIIVRGGSDPNCARVALVDVDGLILNQNLTGIASVGENPVSAFREKLEAAAADPRVRALVIRLHSPGGGVAATDIIAEEMRRFRISTGKPIVASLMDVATGGAYYLAVGADRVIALPTTVTGGIGALVNHANLQDAMAQLNVRMEPIKAGEMIDMGSITSPLSDESRALFQEMANGFRDRFVGRVAQCRPSMTAADRKVVGDGRIVVAQKALELHMVDALGYVEDAIAEAERIAGFRGSEVVLFQRAGHPTRSIYAIVPNTPIQNDVIPFSYPGLERSKLPTFLYLWQPDPTISRTGGGR